MATGRRAHTLRNYVLAAAVLLLLGSATAWAAAPDYGREPALATTTPGSSILLDITRAGKRLVAVGERGIIIYSDDGNSWQQAAVPISETLTAVSFISEQLGWAVGHGGNILHSSNGGKSWQLQFDGNRANQQWLNYSKARKATLDAQLQNIENTDPSRLSELENLQQDASYAIEDAQAAVATGPADPFLDIWFGDANNGIAVGAYGMIYRTNNGGADWQLAAAGINNPDRYHYYSITADSKNRLFLSGEAGLMYRSLDSGLNWTRLGPFYDGSLFGVLSRGDAVLSFGLRGHIFISRDGGESWQSAGDDIPFSLYGGQVLDNGDILLVGSAGGMASSKDGGVSFSSQQHASRSGFSAVVGESANKAFVVGMPGIIAINKREAP